MMFLHEQRYHYMMEGSDAILTAEVVGYSPNTAKMPDSTLGGGTPQHKTDFRFLSAENW